jgi:NAD(P)-dependent dehydrogenase (short-subunit alcohol dehydrogenase family)
MALNPKLTDWDGKRVWLVGASTGIGAALAAALFARGARVIASARDEAALARVVGGRTTGRAVAVDVTDRAALAAAHRRANAMWDGLDVVAYLAGTYQPQRAWELTIEDARRQVEVNLMGAYNLLTLVMPDLIAKSSGAIVLVSSVAGYRGLPNSLAYGPTKAALINLAEALYLDLAPRGIGVHLVNPGFVETPLTARNPFKMPALIKPETAAVAILAGFARGEFETHFPKRFTRALKLLRHLPYRAYFAAVRKATGT